MKLEVDDVGPLLFGFTAKSVLGSLSEVQQSLPPVINGLDEIFTERSEYLCFPVSSRALWFAIHCHSLASRRLALPPLTL